MLGSKKGGFGVSGTTTLIARDTTLVGDVHFSGCLEIEGLVQGNIIAEPGKDAVVRVVDKGRVEGEVRAPTVIINGMVEGDVFSTKNLELAPKGRVQGNVQYVLLEMAAGSEVNGSLIHSVAAEALREKSPDPSVEVTEVSSGGESRGEPVAATKLD